MYEMCDLATTVVPQPAPVEAQCVQLNDDTCITHSYNTHICPQTMPIKPFFMKMILIITTKITTNHELRSKHQKAVYCKLLNSLQMVSFIAASGAS